MSGVTEDYLNLSGSGGYINEDKDILSSVNYSSGKGFLHNSKEVMNFEPDYMKLYEFEKFESHEEWRQWMKGNWQLSVWASAVYAVMVFSGQRWMIDRKPLKLRGALTMWNVGLAGFSAFAFFRSLPELVVAFSQPNGALRSVCVLENHNAATSLYGLLFTWSKIVEFGDTAFIILRKQPLIFLHWYHHITVCIFCWFTHPAYDPSNRLFATMNLLVHSLMYSYYAARSLQFKIPRSYAMFLTCLQISQMVVGLVMNSYSYYAIVSGKGCARPMSNILLGLAMYFSYFLLFANFFYKVYLKKSGRKTATAGGAAPQKKID